jgi:hypothetical protein
MTNGNLQKTPTSTIPIRALNDDEKPREKALRGGMDSLSDVELLALLLGSGVPGKSVLDLSREISRIATTVCACWRACRLPN